MATGLQRLVRRKLLTTLKANSGVTALVPATSINPTGEPTWPHIRLRSPRTSRLRASCVNGAIVRFDIHAFAKSSEAITSEDLAGNIGAAIEAALADTWVTLEGGAKARIEIGDTQMIEDGSPDAHHWFAQINARVLAS